MQRGVSCRRGSCILGRGGIMQRGDHASREEDHADGIMHQGKRIMLMGDHASREEDHADVGIMHLGKRITQREDHALREEDHADDGGDHASEEYDQAGGDRKRIMQIK